LETKKVLIIAKYNNYDQFSYSAENAPMKENNDIRHICSLIKVIEDTCSRINAQYAGEQVSV
jgi:hypothetical protein